MLQFYFGPSSKWIEILLYYFYCPCSYSTRIKLDLNVSRTILIDYLIMISQDHLIKWTKNKFLTTYKSRNICPSFINEPLICFKWLETTSSNRKNFHVMLRFRYKSSNFWLMKKHETSSHVTLDHHRGVYCHLLFLWLILTAAGALTNRHTLLKSCMTLLLCLF